MNDDLISRKALKEAMWYESHFISTITECGTEEARLGLTASEIEEIINNAPTVDTTCPNCNSGYAQGYSDGYLRGKEERPQGEWIENYDKTDGFTWLTCTRCMCKAYEEGYNFCPNCGADMRETNNEAR